MSGTSPNPETPFVWPAVRTFGLDAPWRWLAKGTADLRAAPAASLFYGAVMAGMGLLLTQYYAGAVGLALTTGFLLVGPFLAFGLYDVSRRLERGERVALVTTLTAWRANIAAVGFYALILTLSLAVWIRVSIVVVALFFPGGTPSLAGFVTQLGQSPDAWFFLAAYAAAGSGLVLFAFAVSAVSLPMLLDREDMDAITAMIVSFNVLRRNLLPMLVWGGIIAAAAAIGAATWFIGLVLTLPIIGHGAWHAYREAVVPPDGASAGEN